MRRKGLLFPALLGVVLLAFMVGNCEFGGGGGGDGGEGGGGQAAGTTYRLVAAFLGINFTNPVTVLQAPGDYNRWFIVELGGVVKVFSGGPIAPEWLNISNNVVSTNERGLTGMAFHPNFPATPYFYLAYNNAAGDTVISRFSTDQTGSTVDANSEYVILTEAQPYINHGQSQIAFGADGYLYIGMGDGGGIDDPGENAQNTQNLHGSILRIDVDGGAPYAIPAGNPFSANADCNSGNGCPEIFAWGFRNLWGMAIDMPSGTIYGPDTGDHTWEEVNIVEVGRNYGWDCYEGTEVYESTGCGAQSNYTEPVHQYPHVGGGDCAIIGGQVYRGTLLPELVGVYFFGDWCTGKIWGLSYQNGAYTSTLLIDSDLAPIGFGRGHDGEIYICHQLGGIYTLESN